MIIKPPGHPYEYPDYIDQALQEFKNRNWVGKTIYQIIQEYRETFVTVPICHIKMQKGTMLFRGRKNENEQLFTHLDQIGMKPKDKVKSFGRANIPGEAVFYASTNEETVAREITQWYVNDNGRAQDLFSKGIMGMGWSPFTSFMTISAWHVTEDLNLALLFNEDDQKRAPAIREFAERRKDRMDGHSENYHKSFHKILDFFSSEFGKLDVKHELEYIFSAYYAYEIYHQKNRENPSLKLDGVKYASIANDCRGENIAICEEAFKKKIAFLGANHCYVYNSNGRDLDGGKTALIGRSQTAVLKSDNSFDWVHAEEDVDYIIKVENEYLPFTLPSDGSKFKKAVVRIGPHK
jgi:hypothetical protein